MLQKTVSGKNEDYKYNQMMRKMMMTLAMVLLGGLWLSVTGQTKEDYLNFLYQYMPLPDKTDYSREFYEKNVMLSLQARKEMPWGMTIPEREFRHFVVPVRVNNENLDNSREVFYGELKARVQKLGMKEAILEVNHWCHEHVTYRPSDARTSSPLATLKTAYGRCGEQSTFTVAALRAVGIPARQVYTPRWAHTDDNHAWVEAWADGKWYFLGACEPEPVLNLGWFNESASRGMLMHTKAFGNYDGPEEVMSRTPCYTEINVIDNYAPSSKLSVCVTDEQGKAVEGAQVEFKIYNYAEFYTVASKTTDEKGETFLSAGHGDMLLWVTKDGKVAIQKVSFGKDKMANVVLGSQPMAQQMDIDIVPPPVSGALPAVTAAQREENNRRMAQEDSIRQAYEATMPVEDWRGNYQTIQNYLAQTKNAVMAKKLLSTISKKDLRDISLEVLLDNETEKTDTSDIYIKYVLSPRVENEWLTPYKSFFRKELKGIGSVEQLVQWCQQNLKIDRGHNPQNLRMQPMSVWRERVTDDLGRNIFFVSAARSLGFPARINEVNGKPQYYKNDAWYDVKYEQQTEKSVNLSPLALTYHPVQNYDDPKYYIHFTLSKLVDGKAQLLTYPEEATWKRDFQNGVELEKGEYLLTTGTRLASGKVLVHLERFTIGDAAKVDFTMREDLEEPQVIGSLNAENLYFDRASKTEKSILSTTGRGFYILGIVAPNQEPTNHALRDIGAYKKQMEQWGRKMVLLFQNEDEAQRFNFEEFNSMLPSTVVWGTDVDGRISKEVREQMKLTSPSLPIFLVCDTFNRVVFCLQGYTINLGEQMMKVIRKL